MHTASKNGGKKFWFVRFNQSSTREHMHTDRLSKNEGIDHHVSIDGPRTREAAAYYYKHYDTQVNVTYIFNIK